ncbi:oxidative damage protection protein [Reinekea thalattae]|uniref:Probable Fe(2+)-trafficking protein n=1 Tax=Reinekea thalattae TaxID=2593301 RepID=A0A5C8Z440_9GAMM|nr:oxidative damage protection protein [Reinekea thalattae]TXR51941.1 oxidative damage protection protein [Reinekea thalattae]
MSHLVNCQRYKKELPGLEKPPFPGPKGLEIYQSVSKQAWSEWQEHQTRLINEKQLTVTDPSARKYLMEQMNKFLNGEEVDSIEGFVPTDPSDN